MAQFRLPSFFIIGALVVSCTPKPPPSDSMDGASSDEPHVYDVIVIGAGLSGLTASKVLREAGVDFVVLEATDRIGGRGLTDPQSGIDLGGAWIHGVETNPLTPVVYGMGYATQPTNLETTPYLFIDNHFANERDALRFDTAYEAFEEDMGERAQLEGDAPADGSMVDSMRAAEEALRALPREPGDVDDGFVLDMLRLNAGPLESAADLDRTSLLDGASFLAGPDQLVSAGFGNFVVDFGQDLLPWIKTGQRVTRVEYGPDGVMVEAGGVQTRARKVLVTVSTGVLASGKIDFEPDLPEWKQEAIAAVPMGLMNKVIIEYSSDEVFPLHGGEDIQDTWVVYGGKVDDTHDDMAFVIRPIGLPISVGFFGGQRAWDLETQADKGKAEMVRLATEGLNAMCKASRPEGSACDAAAMQTRATITAWGSTDWTMGAYSAALPGKTGMREVLASPIDSTVYFAGEATSKPTYNGSFAGAYNSGLRSGHALVGCLEAEQKGEACVWR